jgi:hypothetical protein
MTTNWRRPSEFFVPFAVCFGAIGMVFLWLTAVGCGSSDSNGSGGGGASGSGVIGPGFGSGGDGGTSSGTTEGGGGAGGSSGSPQMTDSGPIKPADACVITTPPSGTVGNSGGTVSQLVFAVVGDTRPASEDDVGGYPTSIITKIFQDIEARSPRPSLVIGTGDYQYSSTDSSYATGSEQIGLYMGARKNFSGAFFPAMGNHECGVSGGFSTSDNNNCGPGLPGGVTPNYNAFMNQMMAPIGKSEPYYAINVNAPDGSWTAKFVVTAANSWGPAQQSWLNTTMAQKTTYTFVIRHEPSDAYPPLPPGVGGVDTALGTYPYTLLITGHSHTYGHYYDTPKVVVIGNGGAPLSSKSYGYGIFTQRCDGAIVGDEVDYMTGATDSQFHFVITPEGTITH